MENKPLPSTYYVITVVTIFLQSVFLYYLYSKYEMNFTFQLLLAVLMGIITASIIIGSCMLLKNLHK